MKSYRLFIHKVSPTRHYKEVRKPYDGGIIARVEVANAPAIEQALKNAGLYFETIMQKMPAWERTNILYKVAGFLKNAHEEMALTIAQEGGKPLKDARVEVTRAINTIKMAGDGALELHGEQIPMDKARGSEGALAFTLREPIGPVLVISAFNHPLNLLAHQIGCAFAAGNSVIAKPASATPLSTLKLAEFFKRAGLPDGVLNIIIASSSLVSSVISDPRIRFVNFIGSGDVGWDIRKKVAPGVRVALEHGGTGTAIVDKTADIATALSSIIKGAFYHAGQVCVSLQNLYIHRTLYPKLVKLIKEAVAKLKTGDPTDEKTDVGPLITPSDITRVDALIKEAVISGAKVLLGGKPLSHQCYAPTVLTLVNPRMKVVSHEIFGPVLSLLPYDAIETVIKAINKSMYSFQTAIYSQDIDSALSTARRIESTACIINNSPAFRVDWMPFGGEKYSGLGRSGIKYSLLDMTREKLIVIKLTA